MKQINCQDVIKLLSMKECIEVMRETFIKLAKKQSKQYLRTVIRLPAENILGLMPAYYDDQYFGAKVITIFHKNLENGYPSHQGAVLLFDSKHGLPLAIIDGDSITRIRTGAVSALATELLAVKKAKKAAFIGAGAQARSHLEALLLVRPLTSIRIYDTNREYAENFATESREKYKLVAEVFASAAEAAYDADIISTVSPSKVSVLSKKDVKPGAHINAVGASMATDRELSSDLVAGSIFWCDCIESVLHESGDFLIPRAERLIDNAHIKGEIGDLLIHPNLKGRENSKDITIFEALGLAVEDIAAAKYIYEKTIQ
jgi:ornithine cyclodeaminase